MTKGIFVVGTNTDVGKTYITAELIKIFKNQGINAGYYKAVLSGAQEKEGRWIAGDADYVFKHASLLGDPNEAVTTILKYPASPHLSAQMENKTITLPPILSDYQKACAKYDFVVAEGSGGIVCPLNLKNKRLMLTDVIKALKLEILLVSNSDLGAINSTILTVEYAKQQKIPLRSIILNHYDPQAIIHQDNKKVIEEMTGIKIYTCGEKEELEPDIILTLV